MAASSITDTGGLLSAPLPLFWQCVCVLLAMVVAAPITRRLGLGNIPGYLLAGICLGPGLLGVFQRPERVLHFAELGVVLLLFLIGLEMRPRALRQLRVPVFVFGTSQILLCTLPFLLLLRFGLGWDWLPASLMGAGLALSSTAFVVQLLGEHRLLTSNFGRLSFGILLCQDLAVVVLIALLAVLSPSSAADSPGWWPLAGLALAFVLWLIGRKALPFWLERLARHRSQELFTAAALLLVLGLAGAFQALGLSSGLGAFIGGLLFAESGFRHQLATDIQPFRGLLLGLFFIAIGMSLPLGVLVEQWPVILVLLAAVIGIKLAVIIPLARLRLASHDALATALSLAQVGEFAFVLVADAHAEGMLSRSQQGLLIATVSLSMLSTPLLFQLAIRSHRRGDGHTGTAPTPGDAGSEPQSDVILAGYGRTGRIIHRLLQNAGHEPLIIERDSQRVAAARAQDFEVYLGDAGRLDLLQQIHVDRARLLVLAIDDPEESLRSLQALRRLFPNLPVIARARDADHAAALKRAGAQAAVEEVLEAGLGMGALCLRELDTSTDAIQSLVDSERERAQSARIDPATSNS